MGIFLGVNWMAVLALAVAVALFVLIWFLSKKINWTLVILLSLVLGVGVGLAFSSENNSNLVWVKLFGDVYIRLITALVAPVIIVSIVSSFITLKNKSAVKSIGLRSVFWLLVTAAAAIVLSIAAGFIFKIWGPNDFFGEIASVNDSTVSGYEGMKRSFDQVILGLIPTNIVGDVSGNRIVAIIITAAAIAFAYISVANKKGEESVASFGNLVEATKLIIFRILKFVIKLTPYAVLSLIAASASRIFADWQTMLQLLVLVGLIYAVSFIHAYLFNGLLIKFVAKLNPVKFFKKIFQAQATAFTTQSSLGTLPVTIDGLKNKVGVSGEIANFTAPLGTTIGMPGCTCVWPVLLTMFFVNAAGLDWGVGDYLLLAAVTLILSIGSAGVPGIAVVSSISVFGALGLPVAAVVMLMPVNTVSDMARTLNNVTAAAVSSAIVARRENRLNDKIFNNENYVAEEISEESADFAAS